MWLLALKRLSTWPFIFLRWPRTWPILLFDSRHFVFHRLTVGLDPAFFLAGLLDLFERFHRLPFGTQHVQGIDDVGERLHLLFESEHAIVQLIVDELQFRERFRIRETD